MITDDMHHEVKRNMKEYIRIVKKTLSSKLNAGNVIKVINSWAKSELAELDRKTRKLLTIYGVPHPRSNSDTIEVWSWCY